MFESLGLFKCPLTSYNDEVLNNFINMSLHIFFSLKLYYMMQSMVLSIDFLELKIKKISLTFFYMFKN